MPFFSVSSIMSRLFHHTKSWQLTLACTSMCARVTHAQACAHELRMNVNICLVSQRSPVLKYLSYVSVDDAGNLYNKRANAGTNVEPLHCVYNSGECLANRCLANRWGNIF